MEQHELKDHDWEFVPWTFNALRAVTRNAPGERVPLVDVLVALSRHSESHGGPRLPLAPTARILRRAGYPQTKIRISGGRVGAIRELSLKEATS